MRLRYVLIALPVLALLVAALLLRSDSRPTLLGAATETPEPAATGAATPAAGVLTALTDVTAVSPSPGLLTVSWGGAAHATSFVLFLNSAGHSGDAWLGGGISSHTFTSLPAGVYTVDVIAQQNADGGGDYREESAQASAVTVAAGYTLTSSAGANGAIDPAPGLHGYSRGSSATVTATPAEHYRIESWAGDCAATPATSATCTLTMGGDHTASVAFTAITHTLTTSAGPNGGIEPAPGAHVHNAGTAVTVTATPAGGYQVEAWGGDCAETAQTSATCELTMGGDRTASVTFSLIPITCSSGTAVPNPAANPGLVGDCETLLGLRDALRGTAALNWSAERAIAQWSGVTTGGTPPRVTDISLIGAGLAGVIPAGLGELAELRRLRLNSNRLTGEIPAELGRLSRLESLVLNSNRLSGAVPRELGNLARLRSLGLANNNLTGGLPLELAGLPLTWLWVKNNEFTGCVPPGLRGVHSNDLANLGLPDCGPCELRSAVPNPAVNVGLASDCRALLTAKDALSVRRAALLNWSADRAIAGWDGVTVSGDPPRVTAFTLARVGGAESSGRISPALGELDALTSLTMTWNKLRGPIPAELGKLTNLRTLSLYRNALTGAIPAELGDLTELRTLSLGSNRLTGAIPAELGDLANLEELYLSQNGLSGSIPAALGGLTALEVLHLRENLLTGDIPAALGNLSNLTYLTLTRNELTGCVPPALLEVENSDAGELELYPCHTDVTEETGYNLLTLGAVTKPGSYAFLSDPDDLTSTLDWYVPNLQSYEPDLFGFLIHKSNAAGGSEAALLDAIKAGDKVDWVRGEKCYSRFAVREVRTDPVGSPSRKLFVAEFLNGPTSGCSDYPWVDPETTRAVEFRWRPPPWEETQGGVRAFLGLEPVTGPGRYRLSRHSEVVISIPSGETLFIEGCGYYLGDWHACVTEAGTHATAYVNVETGAEHSRWLPAGLDAAEIARLTALLDQIVASIEIVSLAD